MMVVIIKVPEVGVALLLAAVQAAALAVTIIIVMELLKKAKVVEVAHVHQVKDVMAPTGEEEMMERQIMLQAVQVDLQLVMLQAVLVVMVVEMITIIHQDKTAMEMLQQLVTMA